MRRLPTVECSRSSRSIIKTILTESFIEVGYDEQTLLADFFTYIQKEMPENCCFDELLAQEISLTDEEDNYDDESFCSDDSFGHLRHGHHHHHDCDCYSDMFYHNDHWLNPSRSYHEIRDRLRHRLTNRRREKQSDDHKKENTSAASDNRNLDELLNFINGVDAEESNGDKKRKKARKKRTKNNENAPENNTTSKGCFSVNADEVQPKSKKKKNKKQKNKDPENKASLKETERNFESDCVSVKKQTSLQNELMESHQEDENDEDQDDDKDDVIREIPDSNDLDLNGHETGDVVNGIYNLNNLQEPDENMNAEQKLDSIFLGIDEK